MDRLCISLLLCTRLFAVNAALKIDITFLTDVLSTASKFLMQAANIGQGIADVVLNVVDVVIREVDDVIHFVNGFALDFLEDVSRRAHQV